MKNITVLALGDLHIRQDNLAKIDIWIETLRDHFVQNKYDYIIVMGDTLHSHEKVFVQCQHKIIKYLEVLKTGLVDPLDVDRLCVLVGNHEYIDNQQYLSDLHSLYVFKDTYRIIDRPEKICAGSGSFVVSPYVPEGKFIKALDENVEGWEDTKVIFAHQTVRGAPYSSNTSDVWEEEYPLCISGHIHKYTKLYPNFIYIGSSIPTRANELEDKYLARVTIPLSENKSAEVEMIELNAPRLKEVRVDYDTTSPAEFKEIISDLTKKHVESKGHVEFRVIIYTSNASTYTKIRNSKLVETFKAGYGGAKNYVTVRTKSSLEDEDFDENTTMRKFSDVLLERVEKRSSRLKALYFDLIK